MNLSPEVLYTAKAVRGAITALLSDAADERIVVSAFVGSGADGLLPNAEGIQLICSPTPGGTNPNTLRVLMSKGVVIRFADRLHMKVYWSGSHGAVITSANLSLNALGLGGLKEIGVRLPTQQIDIRRIIASVRPRDVTETELKRLDRKHRAFVARNGWSGPPQTLTFDEWYGSTYREQWKMCVYDGFYEISKTGVAAIQREFGTDPHAGIAASDGDYLTQDWVLCVRTPGGRITGLEWFFVDRIVSILRRDPAWSRRWPKEALQSRGPRFYPPTPFRIDRQFRLDLGRVMNESDVQRLKRSTIPPPSLLRRLIEYRDLKQRSQSAVYSVR